MSINDAKQSFEPQIEYLESDMEENNYDYLEIVVPCSLYHKVRHIDLQLFIDLWIGEKALYDHQICDNHLYDYKSITKLVGSMSLNRDLRFVKILEDHFKEDVL